MALLYLIGGYITNLIDTMDLQLNPFGTYMAKRSNMNLDDPVLKAAYEMFLNQWVSKGKLHRYYGPAAWGSWILHGTKIK